MDRSSRKKQNAMLRITTDKCFKTLRLTVEGRLEGPYVIELENCWQITSPGARPRIKVDITGVTFIDKGGKQLLTRMHEQGAKLIAKGVMTKQIIEEVVKTRPS